VRHATAELEFDSLRLGNLHVSLQVLDHFLSGVVALSVSLVHRDGLVVDLVRDQPTDGEIGYFAKHIQHGKLVGRQRNPDGEALCLIDAVVDDRLKHIGF
jgi:hypothetical protein